MRTVGDLVESHRPGWSLQQDFYVDDDVFQCDLEQVFAGSWLLVAAAAELPNAGDLLTWSIGRDSVVLSRGYDGRITASHNVCRHRGCRLTADGASSARVIVCPYHQWAYGLDGGLRGAPHMGSDLPREELGLRPVHLRDLGGLLFVCFAADPPPFGEADSVVEPQLRLHDLPRTKLIARQHYEVAANWKLLVENNRECYHCRANHPEFCLVNYDLGMAGDARTSRGYEAAVAEHRRRWVAQGLSPREHSFEGGGWFRVARLPLRDGFQTESLSGRLVAPLLGSLPSADVGSLRLVTLPNSWNHVNADHVATTRITPVSPTRTDVDVAFFVRADAVEGEDYTVADIIPVWTATSEQDWVLCEQTAAGVASRGYVPGPLSPVTEGSVATFHEWYLRALAGQPSGAAAVVARVGQPA